MVQVILYFLSRFSVKLKVAFLIVFLISGVLFWNVSYLNDTIRENARTEKLLFAFETAEKINAIVFSLQKERTYSVAFAEHAQVADALEGVRHESDLYLAKFGECRQTLGAVANEKISVKLALLGSEITSLQKIRMEVDAAQIDGDEIVRHYTDALIKHFIDLIALMTAQIESNDFNAYFNLINAIEYAALQQSLVQVAVGREEAFDQIWYDLIITQDAKSQAYLDRFKTFAEAEAIVAYQKLYSSASFIHLNEMLEELKMQVGEKVGGIEIEEWLGYYLRYMDEIKAVELLNSNSVKAKIEKELLRNNEAFKRNVLMLLLPLLFALFVAWFIFVDIRNSLRTLLNFLKERSIRGKDQLLLLQSKSELGTIYRTLFDFNAKIHEQIKIIEHTYETDQLTHIPNRNKLLKEMQKMQESGQDFMIIYIDIQNFSHINDSFGQSVGDVYLQQTARMLQEISGTLGSRRPELKTEAYRMGSDEFVLICSQPEYTELLISKLKETYIIEHGGIEMPLSFTFGIANSDTKHSQSSQLSRAEIASRHAIRTHQRFSYYDEDALFEKRHKENLEWVKKIAEAFKKGFFTVYYQPIARASTAEIVKYEVLIRMHDKERDLVVSPAEFLDVLQNSGHEKELTKLVISQSFKSYEAFQIDLAINMTRDDLDEEIISYLIAEAKKYKIEPASVVIELVESEELLKEKYITIIKQIKRAGFKIAIDDFGTGYSNFAYLMQIKPDYIKIDGSLIERMNTSAEERQVVEGIYDFASKLGIEVVAEFVSSSELFEAIREIGIEYVQGYHIGHVMSGEEILKLRGQQ
ncbi:MAG: EAL domain-containing protein [Campylobacterales bacterium]|nr:EAL domain-containing protein [Campylobacterales bacterium]